MILTETLTMCKVANVRLQFKFPTSDKVEITIVNENPANYVTYNKAAGAIISRSIPLQDDDKYLQAEIAGMIDEMNLLREP